jgi:ankyrin repeat protein
MNCIEQELIDAAKANNLPEVSRLLSVGAHVNAKDYYGDTPLHWASVRGHVQVVVELLEHGADIEAKNYIGETPLHNACCNGHVAVFNELLSRGANMEAKDNGGYTPLHDASRTDHLSVVKALLGGGANILAVTNNGELPVHVTVRKEHYAVSKYLLQQLYATTRRLPVHELLEDLTWSGNLYNNDAPPLHAALRRNVFSTDDVVEMVEYLVELNPALVSSRDPDGSLPLHVACHRGAPFTIVQSLVNLYKASVKSVTPQGDLPLFLACDSAEPSLDTIFLLMKMYPDLGVSMLTSRESMRG